MMNTITADVAYGKKRIVYDMDCSMMLMELDQHAHMMED